MNTLENTVSMMKALPETDLVKIQDFTKKLFQRQQNNCPFPLKSREDIYKDLEISRKQTAEGKCMEMGQALAEIREKYGL